MISCSNCSKTFYSNVFLSVLLVKHFCMLKKNIFLTRWKTMFIFTADFTCYRRLTFVTSKLVITNIIHSLKCIYCNHVIPHDFMCLNKCWFYAFLILTSYWSYYVPKVQQCPPTYIGYLADISDWNKKSTNSVQIFTKQVWLCKGYESHYVYH